MRIDEVAEAVLSAAGAAVTVFDASAKQAAQDRAVADREGRAYADIVDIPSDELLRLGGRDHVVEFSHSLEAQIGGQLRAGLMLTHLFEDTDLRDLSTVRSRHFPTLLATRAVKPGATPQA